MPGGWTKIAEVRSRFLSRARAMDFQFSGDEEAGLICPACQDQMTPDNGRVLGCSHEMCADCLLQLRGAPITHDGQL